MNGPTFSLVLTREQAEHLGRLVSIGELAIAENDQHGWLPTKSEAAALMTTYLKALSSAPSLEQPLGQLREWLRQQGRHP
jgi:hypothetical protein